ncbi:hypothetical protein KCP75_26010 [Salmonella enterica subsp. enterica]|nr:hypothetical protein KCP75_26010 [Salmonella enterica subsp. enterica]
MSCVSTVHKPSFAEVLQQLFDLRQHGRVDMMRQKIAPASTLCSAMAFDDGAVFCRGSTTITAAFIIGQSNQQM